MHQRNVVIWKPHVETCRLCRAPIGDVKCDCATRGGSVDWNWKGSANVSDRIISNEGRDILFHPVISSGTVAIRGTKMLEKNMHHYFEIRIMSLMYGTDLMIGVGTAKANLNECKSDFVSYLGSNDQTWGFSYTGKIQHSQMTRNYADGFSIGTLVGVYLNMYEGTLEYYVNRRPQGVAFKGLKDFDLYPMVASTAAQSAIRLTFTTSFKTSLQFTALKVIQNRTNLLTEYHKLGVFSRFYDQQFFWLTSREKPQHLPLLELADEIVISNSINFPMRKREFVDGEPPTKRRQSENFDFIYEDLDLFRSKRCSDCGFSLGNHAAYGNDDLCSLCEELL